MCYQMKYQKRKLVFFSHTHTTLSGNIKEVQQLFFFNFKFDTWQKNERKKMEECVCIWRRHCAAGFMLDWLLNLQVYFLPVGGSKWVVEREIRFRLPSIDHCVSELFFSFLSNILPIPTWPLLLILFIFLGGTIKLKATHIENGIPQVPKIEDTFFPECVCLSVYIPLWRIAGRPTHSVI